MKTIEGVLLESFGARHERRLWVAEEDVFLTKADGEVIVGPIDRESVLFIARLVLHGEPRVVTDPKVLLQFAAAIVAIFTIEPSRPAPIGAAAGATAAA